MNAKSNGTKTKRIPIKKRNGDIVAWTLVDEDMYEELNQHTWRDCKGYAGRGYRDENHKFINVWMHRVVLGVQESGLPEGYEVDHINRNPLDNRRENLRIVPHYINMNNQKGHDGTTSRFKGVYWCSTSGKWVAKVHHMGKGHFLGRFGEETAAFAATEKFREEHNIPLDYLHMGIDAQMAQEG